MHEKDRCWRPAVAASSLPPPPPAPGAPPASRHNVKAWRSRNPNRLVLISPSIFANFLQLDCLFSLVYCSYLYIPAFRPSSTPLDPYAQPLIPDMSSADIPSSPTEPSKRPLTLTSRISHALSAPIDAKACVPISLYACFLTGFTSSPSFSACYIWCGFQTGNLAQLGLAAARTFAPIREFKTYGMIKPDQQALCSLLSFLIGASLGRVGDKVGNRTRRWLVGATGVQVLLAMGAALAAHYGGQSGVAE